MSFPVRAKLYPKTSLPLRGALGALSDRLSDIAGGINNVPFLRDTSLGRFSDSLANSSSLLNNISDRANAAISGRVSDFVGDTVGRNGGSLGGALGGELGALVGERLSDKLGNIFNGERSDEYFQGPAQILRGTGGLVFPNTPSITMTNNANYDSYDIAHSNYAYYAYKNSRVEPIGVTAKFTINTRQEADYFLGAMHFLRVVTKMNYGATDQQAGVPPPVLLFDALGPLVMNALPVVVGSFSNSFDDSMHYVTSTSGTYVPATTTVSLSLIPYYNPSSVTEEFNLRSFKSGQLLRKGYI